MQKEVVRTRIRRLVVERMVVYETTHKELLQSGRDERSGKKSKRNNCGKMEGSGIFFVHRAVQKEKCFRNTSKTTTGLFISPSGISELDCATTKTDKAERSISIGRESLQGFFLY